MLMNDKIIFDRYYCINSAQTKEIMVHYILQPHHIFICVKVFILMLVPGRLQSLITSMCFVWRRRIAVLINGFLFIKIWLLILCDTGIYVIIMNTKLKWFHFLARLYESTGRAIAATPASASALALALLKMLKFLVKVFMSLYLLKLWMDQVDTLHVGRYWSEVLCCTIMTHLGDLEVKVTDLEILC